MAELVANCPRCGAREITFNVLGATPLSREFSWQTRWETFSVCRKCLRSTVFRIDQKGIDDKLERITGADLAKVPSVLNRQFEIVSYVSASDMSAQEPPEHLPEDIETVFKEGAKCVATKCWNAAGCMFRLCVDMATRALLPKEDRDDLDNKTRRELGRRLAWLFKNNMLPADLRELSSCIREDGNDGAHAGTLTEADALDLEEFTFALLDRHYSVPKRLKLATKRRADRRKPKT